MIKFKIRSIQVDSRVHSACRHGPHRRAEGHRWSHTRDRALFVLVEHQPRLLSIDTHAALAVEEGS